MYRSKEIARKILATKMQEATATPGESAHTKSDIMRLLVQARSDESEQNGYKVDDESEVSKAVGIAFNLPLVCKC